MPNEVNTALARLVRRAEQADSALLVDTFVDGGLLGDILMSPDHQIIYGRRGTRKTHALTYLADRISKSGDLPLLIDLRTIGSNGGIYSNNKLSQSERVSQLLVDVGNEIYYKLQDVLLNNDLLDSDQKFEKAVRLLEDLANGLEQIKVEGDIESEVSKEAVDSRSSQQGLTVSASQNPSATLNSSDTLASSSKSNEKHLSKGKARLRIHFGSISNPLEGILTLVDKRLYVLLDEWSVIPEDLQPYLSDMLKRTILSIRKVTLKIAAIEQRANFRESIGDSSYIGFELGADISADVNLDDFMVFDNDAEKSKEFFKDLFFRHVRADLPETASYATSDMLVSRGFTQINAFEELVRSAEGVPRDAINIAILAAQAANNDPISIPIVRGAARRWYQRDKEKSLEVNIDAERFLRYIVDEVIGARKARAFLVPQREANSNSFLNFLYDARVLHVLKRSVSSKDNPGERFTVFKIDYGCYVELLNTSNAPKGLFDTGENDNEKFTEVPQDDYRSIRRAILDVNSLNTFR